MFDMITALMPAMLDGMITSLSIFFLTLIIGLPLGILISLGRMSQLKIIMSQLKIIRIPVQIYLLIMRGTPLMLQLLFFYFGPHFIFGMPSMDRFWAAVLTFGLNYTAYFAEIFRGGIEGMPKGQPKGQHEAAATLGFTKRQTFVKIILPQVTKRIIPPMGNEFMALVKDTALARVIAVAELFDVAAKSANSYASVIPYIMAAVFYLVMNFVVGQCFLLAERRMRYYR